MKSASTIKKLPIVGMAEGEQIAVIDSILVNRQTKNVAYLSVDHGVPDMIPSLLPFRDIVGVGNDFIVVQSKDSFIKANDAEECLLLTGTTVLSSAGDIIANVTDYEMDEKTGTIEKLLLDNGQEIPGSRLVTLSKTYIFADMDGTMAAMPTMTAPAAPEPAAVEADGLDEGTIDYLMGKTVRSDLRSDDGGFTVSAGTVITRELILEAQRHDALLLLTMEV